MSIKSVKQTSHKNHPWLEPLMIFQYSKLHLKIAFDSFSKSNCGSRICGQVHVPFSSPSNVCWSTLFWWGLHAMKTKVSFWAYNNRLNLKTSSNLPSSGIFLQISKKEFGIVHQFGKKEMSSKIITANMKKLPTCDKSLSLCGLFSTSSSSQLIRSKPTSFPLLENLAGNWDF